MRIFERWYFGLCSNLRFRYRVIILEGFWFLLEDFLKIRCIFAWLNIWVFIIFFFCFKICFNINGHAIVWHTPCFIYLFVLFCVVEIFKIVCQNLPNCEVVGCVFGVTLESFWWVLVHQGEYVMFRLVMHES